MYGKKLLLQINVITGWPIPATEEMVSILVDQFIKNLQEKFPELNIHEIEYAFRKNGTIIPDWGKQMNLSLVDAVLIPYINERFLISQDEERIKEKPIEQKIFSQDELDNSAREDAERQYQMFLSGYEVKNLESDRVILEKDGLLKKEEQVIDLFIRRRDRGILNIYKKQ